MSFPRTDNNRANKPSAAAVEKPYWGWTDRGSFFRSETPVLNAVTGFLHDTRSMLREKFMAPADVELLLRIQPEYVRSAFPQISQWSTLSRPWHWPAAQTSTSAEQTLKAWATPARDDDNALAAYFEAAERFHGYECRFAHLDVSAYGLEHPPMTGACRVHPSGIPHSSSAA
jgi:hypothetical protein